MDDESQELLPGIRGVLHIALSEPPQLITERLYNQKATPASTITSLRLEVHVVEGDDERQLSEAELSSVAFEYPEIAMRGLGAPVRHTAPNRVHFTVRDLLAAIVETERVTRPQSSWFGGVDVHHVLFQGLYRDGDGAWQVSWGA